MLETTLNKFKKSKPLDFYNGLNLIEALIKICG